MTFHEYLIFVGSFALGYVLRALINPVEHRSYEELHDKGYADGYQDAVDDFGEPPTLPSEASHAQPH